MPFKNGAGRAYGKEAVMGGTDAVIGGTTGGETTGKELAAASRGRRSKIVQFHEFGPADVLRLEDAAPRSPRSHEVAIRVEAIGLNWADALWRRNQYVEDATLPSGLGNEAAGVVTAVGEDVTGLGVGDRVAVLPGMNQGRYPTYGTDIVAPATHVVRYAENLSAVEAAAIWVTYPTGYFAMFEIAKLQAGQSVLITGASSGTGQAAIQMAKVRGLSAIATTRTRAKVQALREAGADAVIVTDEQDVVARVLELTNGRGVDLVYDGVGGPQFERLGDAVRDGGWIILYGLSGGDIRFPVLSQFRKTWHFHTYKVSEFTGSETMGLTRNAEAVDRAIKFINDHFRSGEFKVRIDRTFDFNQVVEAHRLLEAATHVGKIVMTV